MVHLSDILTHARGFGFRSGALVPLIDEKVWARLHLSKAEIEAILSESEQLLKEAEGFLSYA